MKCLQLPKLSSVLCVLNGRSLDLDIRLLWKCSRVNKWEQIQMDTGDWEHPVHQHKFRFAMIVDEGSRYRAGKVLSGPPKKAGSWDDLKGVCEQIWLPAHGTPATVRVDPAGPWLNEKADQYFSERASAGSYSSRSPLADRGCREKHSKCQGGHECHCPRVS